MISDPILARLRRSDELRENLMTEIGVFTESKLHRVEYEQDATGLEHRWRMFFDPKPDPLRWGIMVGEVAHNWRAALDNRVWDLVTACGNKPTKSNEFPIFQDPEKYREQAPRKLAGLSEAIKAEIEDSQPFGSAGDDLHHALWVLHELNNIDKHRVILPMVMGQTGGMVATSLPSSAVLAPTIEDGETFLTVTTPAAVDEMRITGRASVNVGFVIGEQSFRARDILYDIGAEVAAVLQRLKNF